MGLDPQFGSKYHQGVSTAALILGEIQGRGWAVSGDSGAAKPGMLYFDSGTNKLYYWDGTSWISSDGGGEANTASNVGSDGLGVFKQKNGVDFEFKNVAPASAKISVVANGDDIDLDVVEAQLSLANLGTKSHANLTDKGTTSHADLDTHVGDDTKHRLINDSGTGATELWSASKIDGLITAITSGYSRREKVITIATNTSAPPTEVDGDRYILDETAGGVHADWDGASANDIVEFVTDTWVAVTPIEGYVAYCDTDDKDALFVDDGTPAWELRVVSVANHDDMGSIDGGASDYQHLTLLEHNALIGGASTDAGAYHMHDGTYYTETELDGGQLDDLYYRENEFVADSGPTADSPLLTNSSGYLDSSFFLLGSDKGLEFATGALQMKIEADKGLALSAAGLAGVANAAKGMLVEAGGFGLNVTADKGLHFNANALEIELNGTTLGVGASGISVLGLPSLFTINGSAVGANVTHTNLDTLVAGVASNADALHTHSQFSVFSTNAGNPNLDTVAGAQGDLCLDTSNTVMYFNSLGTTTSWVAM